MRNPGSARGVHLNLREEHLREEPASIVIEAGSRIVPGAPWRTHRGTCIPCFSREGSRPRRLFAA
jgi:hypothetical protein